MRRDTDDTSATSARDGSLPSMRSMPRALSLLLVVTLLSFATYLFTFDSFGPDNDFAAARVDTVLAFVGTPAAVAEPTTEAPMVTSMSTTPPTSTQAPTVTPTASSLPVNAPTIPSTPTNTTSSLPPTSTSSSSSSSLDSSSTPSGDDGDTNASTERRFAYMFYVTSDTYGCAALHLMDRLVNHVAMDVSRISLVVLHSPSVSADMLARLQTADGAPRLVAVDTLFASVPEPTWQQSLTKLHAFRDWGYDRVVYLDADSVPLQNLDHLFELSPAPLYAPRAYWLTQPFFASTLLVIEPRDGQFDAIVAWATAQGTAAGFDMDILNAFFQDSVLYLPGDYTVLNSDFRAVPTTRNKLYATTTELKQHTQLVHFSCTPDGSYGKPWTAWSHDLTFAAAQGLDPLFAELFTSYWSFEQRMCR